MSNQVLNVWTLLVLQGHDIYGFDLDLLLHRINACKVSTMILIINRLDDEFL